MKNVSVRWKMIILALITLIGTLAIGVLAVNRMLVMEKGSESVLRTSIEEDYDENIKNQVDNAISMLDAVYAGYENGDYSYEEAETRGADLLREVRFDAIRGNISEIKTLASLCGTQEKNSGNMAVSDTMDVEKITDKSDHCGKITGIDGSGRGVDADNADTVTEENLAQHISNAKMLSKKLQTIVAITGAIDLVTDGSSCYVIRNGNPQMGHVTGAGCQLSGILTAFLAANPENKLQAAAAAVCMMGYAGELAAEKSGQSGSGTYRVSLMDAVSCMDGDILERGARYEIR